MAFRSFPGSDTALSLAANPIALPVILTAAGVAVTIGAAAWSYHAYSAYQEKKHRNEINTINELHKRFLEKIYISEYNEIQGFPAIFKLVKNEKSTAVESMHFTKEEIIAIGGTLPHGTDVILYEYRELILNAILELKRYYLDRDQPHDVTSGVLSYLLYILESKCLHFAGYEYDIAYLHALSRFINAYASLQQTENSQHFSRLAPVRGYLQAAQQSLEKHKRDLSLKDMVNELTNHCMSTSKKMIKIFVKMITQENKWKYIDTTTHDELAKGLLRRKYVQTQVLGMKLRMDRAVIIPDSHFKPWLIMLLQYFDQSIHPNSAMMVDDILMPEQLFILPDLERLKAIKKRSFWHTSQADRETVAHNEAILHSIRQLFGKCENYMTMKLDPKANDESPRFISISENEELIERSKQLADFTTLIHQILSLQYLCIHLLKSIKQLGEIYVKNPQHFSYIFQVVEKLCDQIKQSIDRNKETITKIRQANNNMMQLEKQELFPEQTYDLLETTYTAISRLGKQVQDYRDEVAQADLKHQNAIAVETKKAKDEMFGIAVSLARIHHLGGYTSLTPHVTYHEEYEGLVEIKTPKLTAIKTVSVSTDSHRHLSFWQKYRLRIVGALLIICSLACAIVAVVMSFFSGGVFSPLGALLGAIGVKIGFTGLALAGIDGAVGWVVGLFIGSIVNSALLSVDVFRRHRSSYRYINQQLRQHPLHKETIDKPQPIDTKIPHPAPSTTNLFAKRGRPIANSLTLDASSEKKESSCPNLTL